MRRSAKLLALVAFLMFAASAWADSYDEYSIRRANSSVMYFQDGSFWFGTTSSDTGTYDTIISINDVDYREDIAGNFTLTCTSGVCTVGGTGTVTITSLDGTSSIIGTISGWGNSISQSDAFVNLNGDYGVNVTFGSVTGVSSDLDALADKSASLLVTGIFRPQQTLSALSASTGVASYSYSATLYVYESVPEPGFYGVFGLGLSALLLLCRKAKQPVA